MSTDRRIKGLKIRQKSLLASFGLIKSFVDTYDEETGACEIPVRLESLDALWTDFKLVQSELESLDEATIEQQLKQRTDFETAYYRVKGFLLAKNKAPLSPRTNTSSSSSSQLPGSSSHVRLPDVKLPVFCGNLDDWLNFHDLFVSLVHSSHELSNIQKFYYLHSSLAGDALKLIQTVPLSANNYPVAWNLLVDHFQNTARLKQSYLDAPFEFPTLKRESSVDLHSLVEKFDANVKVLKQLGEKTEYWDIILIRMLSIRLDPTTRRDWEEHSSTKDAIGFQDLTSFIQRRVTVLQTIQGKPAEASASTQQFKKPAQRPVASHGASQINVGRKCTFCSDHHPLYMCSSFSKLDVEAKESEVRRHQLCRNCLRTGHHARDCPSSSVCRKCRGRHHTLLCSGENSVAANSRTTESSQHDAQIASTSGEQPKASVSATIREPASYASTRQTQHNVLLATAVVKLVDDNGTAHLARALLDSGSECCFITESFSKLVKAQRKTISVPISGIGQSSSHARYKIVSTIRSRVSDYSNSAEFLVLPKLTIDLPTASFDTSSWQFPPGIHLADPSFHEAKQIDIVVGAEIFFELFKVPGRIPLGDSLPTLVNSVLGWIVSGKVSHGTPTKPLISNVALVAGQHRFTEHFCNTEEVATPSSSGEQATCNEHFQRTARSNTEEQRIDRLPQKEADVIAALVEAESLLPTIYPAVSEPSTIDLHIDTFADDNRTLRTSIMKLATAYVTSERSRSISSKLHLCWFHPFLDPFIRQVTHREGQLNQPPDPFDTEHPDILSAFHALFTEFDLHVALQLLTTIFRPLYWFTGARKLVKSTIQNYIAFAKTRQKHLEQPVIEVPASRNSITRSSSAIGIFYWGFISRQSTHRRVAHQNANIIFLLWFPTYMEFIKLIFYLSTVNFLQPPCRSVFRREFPIMATNELLKLSRCMEYHPWKVALRSAQRHILRVLGYLKLPQTNVKTRLIPIDCCLNSRSIHPLDIESLTLDCSFLARSSLKPVMEIGETGKQKQCQQFWKLLHAENVALPKGCDSPIAIHRNRLVLLNDENNSLNTWSTFRISKLNPGAIVFAWIVVVHTSSGPWFLDSKLYLIPIASMQTISKIMHHKIYRAANSISIVICQQNRRFIRKVRQQHRITSKQNTIVFTREGLGYTGPSLVFTKHRSARLLMLQMVPIQIT